MTQRDWDMLTVTPPEWDWTNDLPEYILPPFSKEDIRKWKREKPDDNT